MKVLLVKCNDYKLVTVDILLELQLKTILRIIYPMNMINNLKDNLHKLKVNKNYSQTKITKIIKHLPENNSIIKIKSKKMNTKKYLQFVQMIINFEMIIFKIILKIMK